MKLEWIEDFLEVANRKSFAEAAQRRGISRSAMGRRIRSLEQWVGAPLCERAPAQVRLTPGGEAFRLLAEGTVRKLHQYRSSLHEKLRTRDDAVIFTAAQGLASRLFPPWLHTIEQSCGQVPYRLFIDRIVVCIDEFVSGRADFLLCYRLPLVIETLGRGGYSHVVVGHETFLPVCAPGPDGSPSHTLEGDTETPLPLLMYNPEAGVSQAVSRLLATPPGRPYDIVFESHFAVVLKAMALDGRGLAWIAETDVCAELASGTLCRAGGEGWGITVEARLYRSLRRLSPRAEALWTQIADRRA